jgi:hypothetical protein
MTHHRGSAMTEPAPSDRTARRAHVVAALADALTASGRSCERASLDGLGRSGPQTAQPPRGAADVLVVDGSLLQRAELSGAWDLVVYLREDAAAEAAPPVPAPLADERALQVDRYLAEVDPETSADVVVDCHDPGWPIIRRVDPAVAEPLGRDLHPSETRAFFAPRAATWEARFPTTTRRTRPRSPNWARAPARPRPTSAAAPGVPFRTCAPRSTALYSAKAPWSGPPPWSPRPGRPRRWRAARPRRRRPSRARRPAAPGRSGHRSSPRD